MNTAATPPPNITLIEPGSDPLAARLLELVRSRELLWFFVWRDTKVRYRHTLLGAAWALLQPATAALVFTVVFGRWARIESHGLPHAVFFFAGLLPWTCFAGAISAAASSVVQGERLMTRVYFPRMILPVSGVIGCLPDFLIGCSILPALFLYYGVPATMNLLLAPLFFGVGLVAVLGIGMWLAALNARFRDVRHALPFALQVWLFASPVVYPASLVPARWQWLYGLNPLAGAIEGFRWSLTGAGRPAPELLLVSIISAVTLLACGQAAFAKLEGELADIV